MGVPSASRSRTTLIESSGSPAAASAARTESGNSARAASETRTRRAKEKRRKAIGRRKYKQFVIWRDILQKRVKLPPTPGGGKKQKQPRGRGERKKNPPALSFSP